LDRVRQQGKRLGRPKKGIHQGRERHQNASERREGHTEGGDAGRLREWHGAARAGGDGRAVTRRRRSGISRNDSHDARRTLSHPPATNGLPVARAASTQRLVTVYSGEPSRRVKFQWPSGCMLARASP
jgi:hypothetical protein